MVRATSVYSSGVPYAARFTAAVKIPLPLATHVSVLEFVSIESYLKTISSSYGSNKEYWITEQTLRKCEERARARARALSACAQTPLIIVYDKGGTVEL